MSKTKDKLSSAERWLTDLVKRVNEQIAEIMNRFHCWYVRTVYGPVTEYRVTIDPLGKAGVTSTLRANGVKSWPLHTHRGVFTIAVKTEDAEEVDRIFSKWSIVHTRQFLPAELEAALR